MTDNREFVVGSVVQLKSGGPKMTVGGGGPEFIATNWFDKSGKHQFMQFHRDQLEFAEEASGLDLTKLSDEELQLLKGLMEKAGVKE